jgi:hypothetical protein
MAFLPKPIGWVEFQGKRWLIAEWTQSLKMEKLRSREAWVPEGPMLLRLIDEEGQEEILRIHQARAKP